MPLTRSLRKLRRMSANEILFRISEKLRVVRERRLVRRGVASSRTPVPAGALLSKAARLVPGASRVELSRLSQQFPEVHSRLCRDLERRLGQIAAGQWNCLGQACDLRGPVEWNRDPVTGHQWSLDFYDDLPIYEMSGGVDVKQVWELGRHQFLFTHAAGWLVTQDEYHATETRRLLLDWIQKNPLYLGVHWTSALEPAVRVISWMWALAALSEWPGWSPGDLSAIATSLEEHGTYLAHHFSVYSSPYNHLIGEAAALYLIGCWVDSPQAAAWKRQASRVLLEHGPKQFLRDGVCVEQAMGYQFFTLMFLTLAWCAAGPGGGDLGPLTPTLKSAWNAAAIFQQPDGDWPAFGDIDSARTVPVIPESPWDFSGLCGLGAVLFGDAGAKAAHSHPGEELFWLLGTPGVESFQRLPAQEAAGPLRQLPDAGYAVFHSATVPGDWLLVDGGLISEGLFADSTPSTAHGHADLLQVLVHVGGKPFLVDTGMSTYAGSRELVDWYRDALAHNTLVIDGAPVARHSGRLGWSHVCHRHHLEAAAGTDLWLAHAGFQPAEGVFADRYILMIPGTGLWIADRVRTPESRRVDWSFNLSASAARDLAPDSQWNQALPTVPWPLTVATTGPALEWRVVQAGPDRAEGWRGTEYGVRFGGTQLRGWSTCQGELVVLFAFTPPGSPVRAAVRLGGMELAAPGSATGKVLSGTAANVPGEGWSIQGGGFERDLAWGSGPPTGGGDWKPLAATGWPCWQRQSGDRSASHGHDTTGGKTA